MDAIRAVATLEELFESTKIDPWFLDQLVLINAIAGEIAGADGLSPALLRRAKRHGFSDAQIGRIRRSAEHTSELQSLMRISSAVFCLQNKHYLPTLYLCNTAQVTIY